MSPAVAFALCLCVGAFAALIVVLAFIAADRRAQSDRPIIDLRPKPVRPRHDPCVWPVSQDDPRPTSLLKFPHHATGDSE